MELTQEMSFDRKKTEEYTLIMRESLVPMQDIDHSPERRSSIRNSITSIAGAVLLCVGQLLNQAVAKTHDPNITRSQVDRIEVNHYYDEFGKRVFSQYIFYQWNDQTERFDVADWRMAKGNTTLYISPNGGYELLWHDKTILRKVWAPIMVETHTQHDPELIDQDSLPKDLRKTLQWPLMEMKVNDSIFLPLPANNP